MNELYFVHGDADLTSQFKFTCSKFNIRNTRGQGVKYVQS